MWNVVADIFNGIVDYTLKFDWGFHDDDNKK